MTAVAESRQLHMGEILAYSLGSLAWALANSDGSLRKTNKAPLASELEMHVSPAETIPQLSPTLIDGMSLVQKMKGNEKTFSQLAESVLLKLFMKVVRASALMLALMFTERCPSKI